MMDSLLDTTSAALTYLTTAVVHPTYFPYLWAPTLHAARISIVYQSLTRKAGNTIKWGPYIAGFLVVCWSGGVLAHLLLGLPPPQFYSFHPYINYISVHIACTAFFSLFPDLLLPKIFDTALVPLDGLLRSIAVTGTLALLENPGLSSSKQQLNTIFGHLVLGAIASSAGGVALSTFSLFSPEWKFSTPPILTGTVWTSADVWGGALAGLIYGAATHQPSFTFPSVNLIHVSPTYYPLNLLPRSVLGFVFKPSLAPLEKTPYSHLLTSSPATPLHARVYAAVFLSAVFASRVLFTHWKPQAAPLRARTVKKSKAM